MSNEYLTFALTSEIPQETDTHAFFTGIVATDQIAESKGVRFNDRALRQIARTINEDKIKVQTGHDNSYAIGKSHSAKYDRVDSSVEAVFDIQKDLEIQRTAFSPAGYSNTDDYIAAVRGKTLTDISVGVEVKRMLCDYCDLEMEPQTFEDLDLVFGFRDKNGHKPNQIIYTDSKGREYRKDGRGRKKKKIIGVMDRVIPFEFSLVNHGAIPGSEITSKLEQAFKEGQLTADHLAMLSDRYCMFFSDNKVSYFIPTQLTSTGGAKMSNVEQLEQQVANQNVLIAKMESNQQVTDQQINELDSKVLDLEDENKELRTFKEQAGEKDAKIKELEDELSNLSVNAHKIQLYDALVNNAAAEAVYQWTRAQGAQGRNPSIEEQEKQSEIFKKIGNYETIMSHADQDRRFATQQQRLRVGTSDNSTNKPQINDARLS